MSTDRRRQVVTSLLVFGAAIFGIVLAGALEVTPQGIAAPQDRGLAAPDQAVRPTATIQGLPSFAELADQVSQAVVSVEAVRIERGRERRGTDPFEFFFGPRGPGGEGGPGGEEQEDEPQDFRSDSGGSGFLVSADGLVVTNYHVIDGATELRVHLGERDYSAEVRGADPATDVALLEIKVDGTPPFLNLGDSDGVRVGDWVMAIGNPLRFQNTVTVGVVSGKGRQIAITPDSSLENFIQTDAAINFGNSGGPLVNLDGEVVGINTAINFGAENVGFAVPVNTLKDILPQLKEHGSVTRGYLGIQISDVDYEHQQAFGLESTGGALVQNVEPGSPSEEAGLEHGDVLLEVDGRPIGSTRDLISYVSGKSPGTVVRLKVVRDGETSEKRVTLSERPGVSEAEAPSGEEEESGIAWLGLQYQDLSARLRSTHGLPEDAAGVWVTEVEPDSPLFDENMRPGDVIAEVNGTPVDGVEAFEAAVGDIGSGEYARLYVLRYDARSPRPLAFFALVRVP